MQEPGTINSESTDKFFCYKYGVKLSNTIVSANEPFAAYLRSQGTCREKTPVTVKTAIISWTIVARRRLNGIEIILNPDFQMTLKDLPFEAGGTFEKDFRMPLCFPADSQAGVYDIEARTTGARFQVLYFWIDGSHHMQVQSIKIGPVECTDLK